MRKLKNAWYILLYHDVSWENNCYVSSIGGTIPPDRFREHVKKLNSKGRLVSIEEGYESWANGSIEEPLFSFWFDDGMTGVLKYAKPILDQYSVTGAVSVCSRFLMREEFFWRFKLGYLNSIDGLRFLRSRLKKVGYKLGNSLRFFTLDRFSEVILEEIESLWMKSTTPIQREDAWRIFLDESGVLRLQDAGWEISNHTAGHYPVSMDSSLEIAVAEFQKCETVLENLCGEPTKYWVIPFDYKSSSRLFECLKSKLCKRGLVYVGNKSNKEFSSERGFPIYRIHASGTSDQLVNRILNV